MTDAPPIVWVGYDTTTSRPVGVCENNLEPHEWAADFMAVEGVRVPAADEIASEIFVPKSSRDDLVQQLDEAVQALGVAEFERDRLRKELISTIRRGSGH